MEAALGSLDECVGTMSGSPPPDARQLSDMARKSLLNRLRPRSYGDSTEQNIRLSEQLWKTRTTLCGPSKTPDEPLSRVMQGLAK